MNPTGRFSNRVEYYVRYRPSYPSAALDLLADVLHVDSAVADIGSGTGISSRWLLQRVAQVYGVEPNREMRERAEPAPGFVSLDGTAEVTGLADASVDAVVCATAFHWFRHEETRAEFRRILKPGGSVVLIWNLRDRTASPFMEGYEQLVADFATDYKPEWDHSSGRAVDLFFTGRYQSARTANLQMLDWDGFVGRTRSASYMPLPGSPRDEDMTERMRQLFEASQSDGRIRFLYETALYWGQITEA